MHQCYYCEQLFESKEKLYDHLEVHSDSDRNKELQNRTMEKTSAPAVAAQLHCKVNKSKENARGV